MANIHFDDARIPGPRALRPTPTLAVLALGIVALLIAVLTGEPPSYGDGDRPNAAPSATMAIEDWRGNSARLPVSN